MLRIGSICSLVMAAAIFFLPWLDLRCETQKTRDIFLTQSGFQAAVGEYSDGPLMKKVNDYARIGQEEPGDDGIGTQLLRSNMKVKSAPLLFGYIAFVVVGVVLGMTLRKGWPWRIGVTLSVVGAFVFLGIQTAVKFPLEEKAEKIEASDIANQVVEFRTNAGYLMETKIAVGYRAAYIAAWGLGVVAVGLALLDFMAGAKPVRKPLPQRKEEDDDDNPFAD